MAPLSRRRQVGRLLLPVETEPPGSRIPDLPVRVFTTVQQVGFRSGGAGFGQSQERLPPHQGLLLQDHWQEKLDSPGSATDQIVVNESWARVWCIWRPKERRIPEDARIHASAFQLMEEPGGSYLPRNLPSRYTVES